MKQPLGPLQLLTFMVMGLSVRRVVSALMTVLKRVWCCLTGMLGKVGL